MKFLRLGFGSASHARKLRVKAEIVLDCDCGVCLRLPFDFHAFLCFHRLVQTFAPTPAVHYAPRVLVHNMDFAVLDNVLNVLFINRIRADKLAYAVDFLRNPYQIIFSGELQFLLLFGRQVLARINIHKNRGKIGHYESVGIVGGNQVSAGFGKVGLVLFFVDYIVKLFLKLEAVFLAEIGRHFHVELVELFASHAVLHQLAESAVFRHSHLYLPKL